MTLLTDKPTDHVDPQSTVGLAPEESRAARLTSFEVSDFPVPNGREEEWRFTPVDRLGGVFADEGDDDRGVRGRRR